MESPPILEPHHTPEIDEEAMDWEVGQVPWDGTQGPEEGWIPHEDHHSEPTSQGGWAKALAEMAQPPEKPWRAAGAEEVRGHRYQPNGGPPTFKVKWLGYGLEETKIPATLLLKEENLPALRQYLSSKLSRKGLSFLLERCPELAKALSEY